MKNSNVSTTDKKVITNEVIKTNEKNIFDIDKINFDKLEKKIEVKSKIESKISNSKKSIYKGFDLLTDKEKKSKRNKLRNIRQKYENDILKFYTENLNKELKESIKSFLTFYKDTYQLNDFSLYSLIDNNTDTEKMKKTDEFLKVIKEVLSIK